jgi:hypothetical protein
MRSNALAARAAAARSSILANRFARGQPSRDGRWK